MNTTEPITLDLHGCARCDGDGHPGITFVPFTRPVQLADGSVLSHWAMCPTLVEPIVMRVTP